MTDIFNACHLKTPLPWNCKFYQMIKNNRKLCGYCLICLANTAKQEKYQLFEIFLEAHKVGNIFIRGSPSETFSAARKLSPVRLKLTISELAIQQSTAVSFRYCLEV